jgi:hypothetical protein
VSNPALGVEPVEPPKRGVEPLSNFSVSNLSNPVEPLSNLRAEPLSNRRTLSIEGFDSTTVRHPGSQAAEEAEKPLPNGSPANDPKSSTSVSVEPLPATLAIEEFDEEFEP